MMDEHALVVERRNAAMLTEAELLRQSVFSIFGKDGQKALKEFRARLLYEVIARQVNEAMRAETGGGEQDGEA
jgi:hypothetical protein